MDSLSAALAEADDRPDMTPLIDCMMVMLLFFIVTTTFSESAAFPAELPPARSATLVASSEAVVVTIARDGAYDVGGAVCPEAELVQRVKDGLAAGSGTVIVRGDKAAPYDKVVLAVDAAHAAGARSWALAVGN
jgi:biopolymer transport protein ExbD